MEAGREKGKRGCCGAGDFIGSAICKRFAAEGYRVHGAGGRVRNWPPSRAKSQPRADRSRAIHSTRAQRSVTVFLDAANASAPLEVCIFNVGGNVSFPILGYDGARVPQGLGNGLLWRIPDGQRAARRMLVHGRGSIFFTGATASLRGGKGFAVFASAKSGLRAVAQSMARGLALKIYTSRMW